MRWTCTLLLTLPLAACGDLRTVAFNDDVYGTDVPVVDTETDDDDNVLQDTGPEESDVLIDTAPYREDTDETDEEDTDDTGTYNASCGSDPYELNQTIATATPTGMSSASDVFQESDIEMNGLAGSFNEDDYYEIEVPSGCTANVTVLFSHAAGDIDLAVTDALGAGALTSLSTSDNETVLWTNNGVGSQLIYARVYAWSSTCSLYDTDFTMTCGGVPIDTDIDTGPLTGACGNDPYEPNESIAAATPTGMAAPGDTFVDSNIELDSNSGAGAGDDFYAVTIPPGCTLDANVYFIDANGDIDLEIQDATGAELDDSTSLTDDESVSWENTGATPLDVYVLVYPYLSFCSEYDIDLSFTCSGVVPVDSDTDTDVGPITGVCGTDPYELNQSIGAAASTGMSTPTDTFAETNIEMNGLSSSIDEDDYYEIIVPSGCSLEAEVLFTNANGDVDLELLDAAGGQLDISTGVVDSEFVTWDNTTTGDVAVYARVYNFSSTCTVYDTNFAFTCGLTVDTAPTTGTCGNDPYEPNDAYTAATPTNMSAPGDSFADTNLELDASGSGVADDFYAVIIPPNCTLEANVYFTTANGDIDLEIQDANGAELDDSASVTDDEYVPWTNPSATTPLQVYVRVYPWQSFCNEYDIDLQFTCP